MADLHIVIGRAHSCVKVGAAVAESTRDILIQSDRPDEARAFYAEVLGFELFQDHPRMRGFETGAFRLFIDPDAPLGPILELVVDDVEDEKSKLLHRGCHIEREDASGPRCYLRDPFGLIFNLRQG